MEKITLNFDNPHLARSLFAGKEENLSALGRAFGVRAIARDNFIRLSGPPAGVKASAKLLKKLAGLDTGKAGLTDREFRRILKLVSGSKSVPIEEIYGEKIKVASSRQYIRPQTPNQKTYLDAIRAHDVTIAIGPAGTGKTYLAMAMAVSALLQGEVRRLILTRPAREAGEKLGFLPGDLYQKVLPYLRPLYDALYDMMEVRRIRRYEEEGTIEIAPLAFMRGRTLNNAFIILDEAQNTTPEQMKMFLTRLGFGSKIVITGDITQIDLPRDKSSGLVRVQDILKPVKGIVFIYLGKEDVVRHELVQKIVKAYERSEADSRSSPVPAGAFTGQGKKE